MGFRGFGALGFRDSGLMNFVFSASAGTWSPGFSPFHIRGSI